MKTTKFKKIALSRLVLTWIVGFMCLPASASLTLVDNGEPRAVVVTAEEPTPVAEFAVDQLVEHVEKATGVVLPVTSETQLDDHEQPHRLFIGVTEAAREQGIEVENLPEHGFLLRTIGDDLYVLGREKADDKPLGRHSLTGTQDGVIELLDRYVGVRWLWPGELGTYVPQTDKISIDDQLNEVIEPAFAFRRFRWHLPKQGPDRYDSHFKRLGVTKQWVKNYKEDVGVYVMAHHRNGYAEPKPTIGHKFEGWWDEHGEEHPEWFRLNSDGERSGPSMCVSNPELHDYILEEDWDGGDNLSLGEVDKRMFCQCDDCRDWDGPQDDPPSFAGNLWNPQMVSDRYARFWKTIADRAVKQNPDVLVTSFLYWNYMPAPEKSIELGDNVYGEFVPWGQAEITYFPLEHEAFEWLKEQWRGWHETGMKMAYRPNHFHGSYVMPLFSTHQAGEFFKFAHEHGMMGYDFDSLIGHWATMGPMLYMYMRLGVKPEMEIEEIRREYFSAFGPAAEKVEEYFDYWERYNEDRDKRINLYNPVWADKLYPAEAFSPAEKILEQALSAAQEHSREEFAERVEFLQVGLEHARLASRLMAVLEYGKAPTHDRQQFREAQQAMKELVDFRREHDEMYYADFTDLVERRENRRLDVKTLLEKDADEITFLPNVLPDPWGEWTFRKDPDNTGMDEKWYQSENIDDEDWMPVEVPAQWQSTEIGDYLGYGWYRTTFELPDSWDEESKVRLKFEGVDEQAWIFVNGESIGEHTTSSEGLTVGELYDRTFEIDVPAEYLVDDENQLVVRVHASQGTGGIWKPVRIYQPESE